MLVLMNHQEKKKKKKKKKNQLPKTLENAVWIDDLLAQRRLERELKDLTTISTMMTLDDED